MFFLSDMRDTYFTFLNMHRIWLIGYYIVHCFNIVPLNLCFHTSGNIIVLVVNCISIWQCETHALWVNGRKVLPHMVSASLKKNWNVYYMNCIHICLLKHTNFSSLRVTWFITCRTSDPDPLLFSNFKSDDSPWMNCNMVGSYQNWVL